MLTTESGWMINTYQRVDPSRPYGLRPLRKTPNRDGDTHIAPKAANIVTRSRRLTGKADRLASRPTRFSAPISLVALRGYPEAVGRGSIAMLYRPSGRGVVRECRRGIPGAIV